MLDTFRIGKNCRAREPLRIHLQAPRAARVRRQDGTTRRAPQSDGCANIRGAEGHRQDCRSGRRRCTPAAVLSSHEPHRRPASTWPTRHPASSDGRRDHRGDSRSMSSAVPDFGRWSDRPSWTCMSIAKRELATQRGTADGRRSAAITAGSRSADGASVLDNARFVRTATAGRRPVRKRRPGPDARASRHPGRPGARQRSPNQSPRILWGEAHPRPDPQRASGDAPVLKKKCRRPHGAAPTEGRAVEGDQRDADDGAVARHHAAVAGARSAAFFVPDRRGGRVRNRGAGANRRVPRPARARVGTVPVHGRDLGPTAAQRRYEPRPRCR